MTNSKSPLIHVKAIKTKYFQVDKHVTENCSNFLKLGTFIGQLHISGFGKMPQSTNE